MHSGASRLAGVANVALRALNREFARQNSPTTASSSPSPTETPSPTPLPDGSTSGNGNGGNNNNNSGGSGSSPLLFFVALGFGVVFTNLWIIVGVKYCFRYNARNRNMRVTGEDGEPINLENMPAHPRRRRREKKLMSIDEVNEKFPMMKYKGWVASRAQEGLPTHGGISQAPSRAGSIQDAEGILPLSKERDSVDETRTTGGASLTKTATVVTADEETREHCEKAGAVDGNRGRASMSPADAVAVAAATRVESPGSESEREEHDRIHDAVPPDALESGDTCAICIDTLEDDDDVRGLTCGHAFHAVCLDPWLTSRRACCPLCKADYYTPKPRPPQPDGAQGPEMGPTVSIAQVSRARLNMPSRPGVAWVFSRRGIFQRSGNGDASQQAASPPRRSRTSLAARTDRTRPEGDSAAAAGTRSGGFISNIRLPRFRLPGRTAAAASNAEVSPSNLEAGTRAETAR